MSNSLGEIAGTVNPAQIARETVKSANARVDAVPVRADGAARNISVEIESRREQNNQ